MRAGVGRFGKYNYDGGLNILCLVLWCLLFTFQVFMSKCRRNGMNIQKHGPTIQNPPLFTPPFSHPVPPLPNNSHPNYHPNPSPSSFKSTTHPSSLAALPNYPATFSSSPPIPPPIPLIAPSTPANRLNTATDNLITLGSSSSRTPPGPESGSGP